MAKYLAQLWTSESTLLVGRTSQLIIPASNTGSLSRLGRVAKINERLKTEQQLPKLKPYITAQKRVPMSVLD
jgi:enolase